MKPLILVSGYARSGTSLMCRMLSSAGLPVIVDHERKDKDNPYGYYESRRVSQLAKDCAADREFVKGHGGHVLKVLCHMLRKMPTGLPYQTIYMMRDSAEIRWSVEKMNARRMKRTERPSRMESDPGIERVQKAGLMWMERRSPLKLIVPFRELVSHPLLVAHRVEGFLGLEGHAEAMAACVDTALYRNRSGQSGDQPS